MDLFERAVGAGAQLLKADRLAPLGTGDESRAVAFLMTFDVGRILVSADPARGRLAATAIPDADDAPTGLVDASEDEPWWRLLGAPLARAQSDAGEERIRLQFQVADGRVRTLALQIDGAQVHAALAHDA